MSRHLPRKRRARSLFFTGASFAAGALAGCNNGALPPDAQCGGNAFACPQPAFDLGSPPGDGHGNPFFDDNGAVDLTRVVTNNDMFPPPPADLSPDCGGCHGNGFCPPECLPDLYTPYDIAVPLPIDSGNSFFFDLLVPVDASVPIDFTPPVDGPRARDLGDATAPADLSPPDCRGCGFGNGFCPPDCRGRDLSVPVDLRKTDL